MDSQTCFTPNPRSPVSSKPLDSPNLPSPTGLSSRSRTPRLGDFARLHDSAISAYLSKPTTPSASTRSRVDEATLSNSSTELCDLGSQSCSKLGNFSKIFDRLGLAASLAESSTLLPHQIAPEDRSSVPHSVFPTQCNLFPTLTEASPSHQQGHTRPKTPASASGSDIEHESDSRSSTPATTPPSSAQDLSPLGCMVKAAKAELSPQTGSTASPKVRILQKPKAKEVLTYQKAGHGPKRTIYGHVQSREGAHETLVGKLVAEGVRDRAVALKHPSVAASGIHVFLDMSNINISFTNALRVKWNIPESDRFVPLPRMNLDFLQEILVRGREAQVLNVGCSMHPNRSEPEFVHTLRRQGYRVDLRYRRPEQEHMARSSGSLNSDSSSDELRYTAATRYVEDMVDETLQTRIGESVMEHFEAPGTLVLATGDARPAKFSDGFFAYADRALKMGWSVEVVSWKCSLSSSWRNPSWAAQWGGRFRIIELDTYLMELLDSYA